jgi:hypothetical protein
MKIGGTSNTSRSNPKRPTPRRGASIENKLVRTSTLATLDPVTNSPDQRRPRGTLSDEKCIASKRGGAEFASIRGVGIGCGAPTDTHAGTGNSCAAQPANPSANAHAANNGCARHAVIDARVVSREALFLLCGRPAQRSSITQQTMLEQRAGRSLALDYAVGICGVWVSSGFFLDAWAHGHVPVETFFTPYHAVFYSGMLAMIVVLAVVAAGDRRRGLPWNRVLPPPYRLAVLGVPIFIGAGIGDMLWHRAFGLEEGVDALLSPTHQIIGLGVFFLASGPIRSVLADREGSRTFLRQLPLAFGLATWLTLAHFGTAYAFDPAGALADAPPPIAPFTPAYLTALSIGYYKISLGVLVVIFQSALVSGFALWWVSRIRPAPGLLTTFYVLGTFAAAAAFTNQSALLTITIAQALLTGILADVLVLRYDPRPDRARALRWFAAVVPMTYSGIYLIGSSLTGGLWWDWNVALGAWIWSGVTGFALSLLTTARRTA